MLLAATNSARADWPMAGANPQRTSWGTEGLTGTMKVVWGRPIEAFLNYNCFIAANGLIYVSTARGVVALDGDDGALV